MKADTSADTSADTRLNLIDLPAEVHERVLAHLDRQSELALRATCKTMRFHVNGFGDRSFFALTCLFKRSAALKKMVLCDSARLKAETKFEKVKTAFLNATRKEPKDYLISEEPYLKPLQGSDYNMKMTDSSKVMFDFKNKEYIPCLSLNKLGLISARNVLIKNFVSDEFPINLKKFLINEYLELHIENCPMSSLILPEKIRSFLSLKIFDCPNLEFFKIKTTDELINIALNDLSLVELPKLKTFPEVLYNTRSCSTIKLHKINPMIEVDTKRFFEITGLGKISLDNAMVKSMGGDAKIIEYKKANQSIIVYKADGVTEDRTL